jgi:hypothetical protein
MDSVNDTHNFLCLLRCEQDIAMKVNIVEVLQKAGKRPAFKAIRGILQRTTNITSLTLRLSSAPSLSIFSTTPSFVNLTVINSNIPHTIIAPFLARHPDITSLVLDGTCGNNDTCPLGNCRLPLLEELTCPPSCVCALTSVGSPLQRLEVVQNTAQNSTFPLEQLFNTHQITTTSVLTVLHLDFDHTASKFGLLQRISDAAPGLIVLKLTEAPFSDKVRR